ncbi:alpha-E domain-containing protein [Amphritea sp. 1_MG-2023]|uniref:alpha-E domain-containing protein n=1 Tax=Amphritea sp. 1_MG-2023 TaxID=3062670 RepID=UPI0026E41956|nr:alpha-E domain-containing protein [Amphritea sp. 1_MG-2023]MDO6563197.1 alpha-E domain-containing protein [Amphritea sp. 1_MG-2023]
MLSKVAERMYWFSRYIERAENTARMVGVYDNLLFDLPRAINISWFNLVVINSSEDVFNARYTIQDEKNVVKLLLADSTNPNSMASSLQMARENVRTSRDVLPLPLWELINELCMYVSEHIRDGINRTNRHGFLDTVIKGCQQINGLLADNMSKDAAWQFIRLGRNLERADMASRILDAGITAQLNTTDIEQDIDPSQIIWGNVLRSCDGSMNYRRTMRVTVEGTKVCDFLLHDKHFPRSISFCAEQMMAATSLLPACDIDELKKLQQLIAEDQHALDNSLSDYLNELQLSFARLHQEFAQCWFAVD